MSEQEKNFLKNATIDVDDNTDVFYLRYYSGHQGRFGHEFLEFDIELNSDKKSALVRYTNSSSYRRDELIRKEFTISSAVVQQIKKFIADNEILKEDDAKWPSKDRDGKQELEIQAGKYHISFETKKIGSLTDVRNSDDPEGLRVFYYFVQDIKVLVFSLISLHFKVKPI